jgi:lipopolysaccharide heptosyltransferase III
MKLHLDCRHFRNDKPCKRNCACGGCDHHEPMGTRILIVKLDAVGDVARTTSILKPLRKKYGPCHITWLVAPAAEGMLRGNSQIDQLLTYVPECLEPLRIEEFDFVFSLDKTPRAAAVGTWAKGEEKLGFGLSPYGTVYPIGAEAHYAFQLGMDDDLKFCKNTKTYQRIIFDCCRLDYQCDEYCIEIDDSARTEAARTLASHGIAPEDRVIGLNLGGGKAFAHKMWAAEEAIEFIKALQKSIDCKVLLYGAKMERTKIDAILAATLPHVYDAATPASIPGFQALLGRCDVLVTGDSLGMHLAIAEKCPIVALFGPTCAQEIELYGRGERIVSPNPCVPCYQPTCAQQPTCMQSIKPDTVVEAVQRLLP